MGSPFSKRIFDRRHFLLKTGGSLFLLGCSTKPSRAIPSQAPSIIQATDARSQIKLPPGWQAQKDLSKDAEIQAGDPIRQSFLVVLTGLKQDFANLTYRDHARKTLADFQKDLEAVKGMGGPVDLVINGMLALRHEFTAITGENRTQVYYLHTTVAGINAFHQLIAWTLFSRIGENRESLETVIGSFEDFS